MQLPYEAKNADFMKQLRKEMTQEERHLWYDFLRGYPVKFYRQRRIDRYIVDFYCNAAQLVVELDGGQHYTEESQTADDSRTKVLERYHLHVLRFSNLDIQKNFYGVCSVIDGYVKNHTKQKMNAPKASPARGGGTAKP